MNTRNLIFTLFWALSSILLFSGCSFNITFGNDEPAETPIATEVSAEPTPTTAATPASTEMLDNNIDEEEVPQLDKMRYICDLAVLRCQYHNVARATKTAGTGISHLGETDRDFWIEFTGNVEISYDQTKLTMQQDGTTITLSLPEPKIECTVDPDSWTEDSYIIGSDRWYNHNPITAEDQIAAIEAAQNNMEEDVRANTSLVTSAELQVKSLIENYINQIGNAVGVKYTIVWDH